MRVRRRVLALFASLSVAGTAGANAWDLTSQLSGGGNYNGLSADTDDRGIVYFAPRISINSSSARYRAGLSYSPRVQLVATSEWENAWSHVVSANLDYSLGELTTLVVRNDYRDIENFNFGNEVLPDGTIDVNTGAGTERSQRNFASVTLQHALSPTWQVSGTVSHALAAFNQDSRSDNTTLQGFLSINHTLTGRQNLGVGLASTYSVFDESTQSQGERYTNVQMVASWQYRIDTWLRIQFRGGPALQFFNPRKFADQFVPLYLPTSSGSQFVDFASCTPLGATVRTASSCTLPSTSSSPPAPPLSDLTETQFVPVEPNPQTASSSITFFGTATLLIEEDPWSGEIFFRRTESNESGQGAASSVNSAGVSVKWVPDENWRFNVGLRWSQRKSLRNSQALGDDLLVIDGPGGVAQVSARTSVRRRSEVETTQYSGSFRVARRLTDNLAADATFQYVRQESSRQDSTERMRVSFQFVYSFPTITL